MTRLATLWALALFALGAIATTALAQDIDDIDFGDDLSTWANDGECDDPRFSGDGMAATLDRQDLMHDATDCRALLESGEIEFSATQFDATLTTFEDIDLGDDSGRFPEDGECDDPRFEGPDMSSSPDHAEIKKDRTDCSFGLQMGSLTVAEDLPPPLEKEIDGIEFGHDKGSYSNDGECDDPRFAGAGMATIALDRQNIGGDRTDCLAAWEAESIRYIADSVLDGFDFGDDKSLYAKDGECDDPRFVGDAMSAKPAMSGLKHDASDCLAAWKASDIEPVEERDNGGILIRGGIVFGDDTGQYADDGECDDPGFVGLSMASGGGSPDHAGHDRTDCLAGFESGSLKPAPPMPMSATIVIDDIDFGDNSSAFASDGECDDPRFEGDGMSARPSNTHRQRDAIDCLMAYQSGLVERRE